jgi:hypothetical protein
VLRVDVITAASTTAACKASAFAKLLLAKLLAYLWLDAA